MRLALPALILAVAVPACGDRADPPAPSKPDRCECEVALSAPAGFELQRTFRHAEGRLVAVREAYRDDRERELHFTSGIAGEFGEGMPLEATLSAPDGGRAVLLGRAPDWILVWTSSGPCRDRSLTGNGFTREEFLRLVRDLGFQR